MLIEGSEAQRGLLPNAQLINFLWRNFSFHRQGVRIGHDEHDGLTRRHNTADRMHGEFMHEAVLWSMDIDAFEVILGGNFAFHELGDFRSRVGKILTHVAAQILIDLNDLQFGLGDLTLGLGPAANELTTLAFDPRRLALEACQPVQ